MEAGNQLKVAVTVRLFSRRIVQTDALLPLVELQPLQPPNVDEPVGEAVKASVVPVVNWSLQDDGVEQLIAGPLTVPVPLPAKLMVSVG